MTKYTKKEFDKLLKERLNSEYGTTLDVASNQQIYRALAIIARRLMSARAAPTAPAQSRCTTCAWNF